MDEKLYAIIFGESILNDSVAIVLFSTLGHFRDSVVSVENIVKGIVMFVSVLLGSVLVGVVIALICALSLKNTHMYKYASIESCILALLAFSAYLLSNAVKLSGIVSLLFCGITLRHYAYSSLSKTSRKTTKEFAYLTQHVPRTQSDEREFRLHLPRRKPLSADSALLPTPDPLCHCRMHDCPLRFRRPLIPTHQLGFPWRRHSTQPPINGLFLPTTAVLGRSTWCNRLCSLL